MSSSSSSSPSLSPSSSSSSSSSTTFDEPHLRGRVESVSTGLAGSTVLSRHTAERGDPGGLNEDSAFLEISTDAEKKEIENKVDRNDDSSSVKSAISLDEDNEPEEKEEIRNTDVIISGLGSHTVNWIKKRRSQTSQAKVAMTFHSEKQLRKIFNGFDFDSSGTGIQSSNC